MNEVKPLNALNVLKSNKQML